MRTLPSCVLLLAGALGAQTYYVGGSGANFTDIQQAVNAVPSGSVLRVRNGYYASFQLQNKSLTIIGDTPLGVIVSPASQTVATTKIGPTNAGQKVVLKNLAFAVGPDINYTLSLDNLQGPAWLEDVTATGNGLSLAGGYVTISNCADVHLLRFSMVGPHFYEPLTIDSSSVELAQCQVAFDYVPNALKIRSSRVACIGSVAKAGFVPAISPMPYPTPSAVVLSLSSFQAWGGSTLTGGGSALGPGGHAIDASGSQVVLADVLLQTAGGTVPGKKLNLDATSTSRTFAVAGPTCAITGNARPGLAVKLDLRANAGDTATLLLGQTPLFFPAPFWLSLGTLFVEPLVTFGSFAVPAGGTLSVPLQLPPSLPFDELFVLQFAVLPQAVPELWASNATSILVGS